jgi:hypothetical protein
MGQYNLKKVPFVMVKVRGNDFKRVTYYGERSQTIRSKVSFLMMTAIVFKAFMLL